VRGAGEVRWRLCKAWLCEGRDGLLVSYGSEKCREVQCEVAKEIACCGRPAYVIVSIRQRCGSGWEWNELVGKLDVWNATFSVEVLAVTAARFLCRGEAVGDGVRRMLLVEFDSPRKGGLVRYMSTAAIAKGEEPVVEGRMFLHSVWKI
jgi:hypothetical protein